MALDDLDGAHAVRPLGLHGEERGAAAHRGEVELGVGLQEAEIAVRAGAVAAVAGNDADAIRRQPGLDQFAKGAVCRAVIMELCHDQVSCHCLLLPCYSDRR